MMRYLCPPCVHPFVHLLSLLSLSLPGFSFLSHLIFLSFFCFLCLWPFFNMFLGFLQFFVCLPFCWDFLHIYVFLPVCHFFPFLIVSIVVFILLCFGTFSFFVSFLEHLYFLCVSPFKIVYFFECISFLKIGWSSFFCLFYLLFFTYSLDFKRENKTCFRTVSFFFETRNGVAHLFLFSSFSKKYSMMFSPSDFFSVLWKRLFFFLEGLVFTHFETSFFYLHFFSLQKSVQHFPFWNVSFTSLIPPFGHLLSICSFFFLSLRVFQFRSPFLPFQKNSVSFIVSLFSLSFTFFTVFLYPCKLLQNSLFLFSFLSR